MNTRSLFLSFCILVIACSSAISANLQTTDTIPYKLARNYFVKNTHPDNGAIQIMRITSQEQFDGFFGAAAYMGEDGQPTAINFEKEYVIALVGYESNQIEPMTVFGLTQSGDRIHLAYGMKFWEAPMSHSIRPALFLIVDEKYQGELTFTRCEEINGKLVGIPGSDGNEYGCIGSAGYTWSKFLGECVRVWEVGAMLRPEVGTEVGVYAIISKDGQQAELIFPSTSLYAKSTILQKDGSNWTAWTLVLSRKGEKGFVLLDGDKVIYASED